MAFPNVFWSADHHSVETENCSRIIITKIELETQGVLMWTEFISVQTQVRSCEYSEETLGSIHCGKLLHKLKNTVLHEMLCHVIQNCNSCFYSEE